MNPTCAACKQTVELAGAQWVGVQPDESGPSLVLFRDPKTKTTLSLEEGDVTVARIHAKLAEARALFAFRPE
jgi:hypothetical protein